MSANQGKIIRNCSDACTFNWNVFYLIANDFEKYSPCD